MNNTNNWSRQVESMGPRCKGPLRKLINCTRTSIGHFGHLKLRWMGIGHDETKFT